MQDDRHLGELSDAEMDGVTGGAGFRLPVFPQILTGGGSEESLLANIAVALRDTEAADQKDKIRQDTETKRGDLTGSR